MNKLTERLLSIIIFAALFGVIGWFVPKIYYQYLDKTQYIEYVGKVTFDKSKYEACETQFAQSTFKILIDTPIHIESRLYLQREGDNKNEIIKEYKFDSFLQAQPEPQVHIVNTQLPCDLKPGVYFYRGILIYKIRDVEKVTPFASDLFAII